MLFVQPFSSRDGCTVSFVVQLPFSSLTLHKTNTQQGSSRVRKEEILGRRKRQTDRETEMGERDRERQMVEREGERIFYFFQSKEHKVK